MIRLVRTHQQQEGFTVIELMISTLAFSLILLGFTAAVMQIGRMFYKGVIMVQTQDVARAVADEISRPIQFSKDAIEMVPPAGTPQTGAICIGDKRYTYALNAQVNDTVTGYQAATHRSRHALWQDTKVGAACTVANMFAATPSVGGREMIGQHMRLATLSVQQVPGQKLWTVNVSVVYGDDDGLVNSASPATGCRLGVAGAQWCSMSTLKTQVHQRLQ